MREYGFSLTLILAYKHRTYDSVLIGRIRVSENPYSRICSVIPISFGFLIKTRVRTTSYEKRF